MPGVFFFLIQFAITFFPLCGHSMAQGVSHWPVTVVAPVQSQATLHVVVMDKVAAVGQVFL
jgi:hypothetical protein